MSRGDGPSLPLDVRIPGVGRVHRRSGVRTARERNALVAMLQELPKRGFRSLVVDVQAGRRTPLELYGHYTGGTLEHLLRPTDDRPLAPLFEVWLEEALVAPTTRALRRDVWAALRPHVGRGTLLRDVPDVLAAYRGACERAGHPRAFNVTRTCLQAFARDTVGKRHALALAVADTPMLKERRQGRRGFALAEALEIRAALSPEAAACWWAMCCTGMGPKEYWVDGWRVEGDRVHISGTKASGRDRDVPLVEEPGRPTLTRDGFTSALRRLEGPKVTPYQARKSFARWMEDAQIPRIRRRQYLGHGEQDVSDKYEGYEVDAYLREDAERLRALLPRQGIRLAS